MTRMVTMIAAAEEAAQAVTTVIATAMETRRTTMVTAGRAVALHPETKTTTPPIPLALKIIESLLLLQIRIKRKKV